MPWCTEVRICAKNKNVLCSWEVVTIASRSDPGIYFMENEHNSLIKNRTFSRYCYTEAIPLLLCMLLDTCTSGVVCGQISLDKKDWEGRNVEWLRKSTYTQCVALFLGHSRFYLTAMEKIGIFHSCEIKSGSGLETRLLYVELKCVFFRLHSIIPVLY